MAKARPEAAMELWTDTRMVKLVATLALPELLPAFLREKSRPRKIFPDEGSCKFWAT